MKAAKSRTPILCCVVRGAILCAAPVLLLGCGEADVDGTVVVRPGSIEFGEVSALPVPFHRRTIDLRNPSPELVVVDHVETSDGLRAEFTAGNGVLQANGGEAKLEVILDARVHDAGQLNGAVTILWKGALEPVTIPVTAEIREAQLGRIEGPRVRVVGGRDWKFGTINRQAVIYHDFELENIGSNVLHILSVETKCGCVQGWVDQKDVAPNETIPLHVRVTASVYPGHFPEKTVYVTTNDPLYPQLSFFVGGRIVDGVEFTPSPIDFGVVKPGAGAELTVTIARVESDVPRALELKASTDFLEVERLGDGEKQDVVGAATVRVKPDAPLGPFEARLIAVFPDQKTGTFEAFTPVRGTIGKALEVRPSTVNFGVVEPRQTYKRKLFVREVSDIANLEVKCEMTYLTADVTGKGGGAEIALVYTPADGMGTTIGQVELADTVEGSTFRVPITAQFTQEAEGDAPQKTGAAATSTP